MGGGLKAIGIEAGVAQKGGYREWEKGKIKEREDYAKTLEHTSGTIFGKKFFEGEKERMEIAEGRLKVSKAAYEKGGQTPQEKAENKRVLDEVQEEVSKLKRAPQEGYAKGLEWGPGKFFHRNTKAAENILKEVKKSKEEKDMNTLKKLLKDSEEKAVGGGEKKEEKPKEEGGGEKKPEEAH
jgi:hypothetical protein